MVSGRLRERLKNIVAVAMLFFLMLLAVHPVSAGLALIGLLFVPILFWILEPLWSAVTCVESEEQLPSTIAIRRALFQRPPPSIL